MIGLIGCSPLRFSIFARVLEFLLPRKSSVKKRRRRVLLGLLTQTMVFASPLRNTALRSKELRGPAAVDFGPPRRDAGLTVADGKPSRAL